MSRPIRVLVVDDHRVVREGLRLFLAEEADAIVVVGEAADGEEGVAAAERLRPDVVLMDLVMPKLDGVAAIRRLRERGLDTPVLVLTTFAGDSQVRDAIAAGAIGYLLKDLDRHELVDAIRAAARGRPTLHPEAQRHLIRTLAPAPPQPGLGLLSPRERDVLRLLAEGLSNKRIADRLGIRVGTVKGYVSAVLEKLGVADRTQAALFGVRHGLLDGGVDRR